MGAQASRISHRSREVRRMKRNAASHLGADERNRNNAVIGEEEALLPQWHVREAVHLIGSHHECVDVALALLSNLSNAVVATAGL